MSNISRIKEIVKLVAEDYGIRACDVRPGTSYWYDVVAQGAMYGIFVNDYIRYFRRSF